MHSRLSLIKSRFAALRHGAISPACGTVSAVAETFHPAPSARHAGTCGGVKFYSNPIVAPDEALPADFVPVAVEEFQSIFDGGLNAAELAAVDLESAAVLFESDFDSFPPDFSPDAADPAPMVTDLPANVAPKVVEKRGPIKLAAPVEVAAVEVAPMADEFEFLRQRVLAMARS